MEVSGALLWVGGGGWGIILGGWRWVRHYFGWVGVRGGGGGGGGGQHCLIMLIDSLDWESALNNLDVNHQFSVFNLIIMNVVTNFIANETMS